MDNATLKNLRLAERVIRGSRSASDSILVEEATNIAAARAAGVAITAIYLPYGSQRPAALSELGDVPTLRVEPATYRGLFAATRRPRVFAVARIPPAPTPKAIASRAGDLVVLDGTAGPGNIGSVIRLAAAYDAAGVVVIDASRRELYRRGVIRASTGAIFQFPVTSMKVNDLLTLCSRNDITVVATSPYNGTDVQAIARCEHRLAHVFGRETTGVRGVLASAAGRTLHIPLPGRVESLNVASAAAIVLFARHALREDAYRR